MKFIQDKTTIIHKKYGKGVFKRYDGQYIVVEFSCGELTLSLETIKKGIMTICKSDSSQDLIIENPIASKPSKDSHATTLISSDGFFEIDDTNNILGGNRIWEFDEEHDKLSFNSSFCMVGKKIKVSRIRATYDLIIMGDVQVTDVIEVKGNLIVYGNIEANAINVGNDFTCNSKVVAESVEVGANIMVKDFKCKETICGGNILAENDVDVKLIKTNRSILSGGGIYSDKIYAQNSIAVDLVECGECVGNIYDLSDIGVPTQVQPKNSNESLIDLDCRIIKEITKSIQENYASSISDIKNYLQRVAKLDMSKICDMTSAYQYLVEIMNLGSISNLRDYIILQYCKKILMPELLNNPIICSGYERLDVITVGDIPLMEFKAKDMNDFVFCLKIVNEQIDMFYNMKELILDKIFQSIGIKYNTVKGFLNNI